MKAGKIIIRCFIVAVATGFAFAACKKTHEYTLVTSTDDTQTQSIIAGDEVKLSHEFEQAVNDAIIASSVSATTSGRTAGNILYTTITNAVIDTNQINTGLVKITYFGKSDDNTKARTGDVKITHAISAGKVTPWGTKGAVATIVFADYEVTPIVNNQLQNNNSVLLNGTATITNVSGGMLKNIADPVLVPGDTIADVVSAQLTYTNNEPGMIIKTWPWNVRERRFFSYDGTTVTMKVEGDTTISSFNNVADWGRTRSDQNYYAGIAAPVTLNMSGTFFLYYPLSGVKVVQGIAEPVTMTYGVDRQGNPAGGGNPYGYKIAWINSEGQTKQAVIGY